MYQTTDDVFDKYQKSTIALKEVPDEKVQKYGIIKGEEIQKNIYKINHLVEKPTLDNAPSNLAITGRYILTPDIFDKIKETEIGIGDELHLTDALSKLDAVYGVAFDGKSYSLDDRLEWLKTSIGFAIDDGEFKSDLIDYMKTFI